MARCIFLMFVTVFVFAALQIGDGLKCYHCSADPGTFCDNPVNNASLIRDCVDTTPDQVCYLRKIDLTGNVSRITRGCISRAECKGVVSQDGNSTCTSCEKDLCNSSPTVVPSFFVFSVIGVTFMKLYL